MRTKQGFNVLALVPAFLASGCAGMGYQVVWIKRFGIGIGNDFASTVSIVAAIMAGMAVGAGTIEWFLKPFHRPALWLAALEILGAIGGVLSVYLIPLAAGLYSELAGPGAPAFARGSAAFGLPLLVLLPASSAMGASMPVMVRLIETDTRGGRCVGWIYGALTLGGAAGVLAAAFLLLPRYGSAKTTLLLAGLHLLSAGVILAATHGLPKIPEKPLRREAAGSLAQWRILLLPFCSGFLGIGFELCGIRALSQVLENTVYTFSVILAVYLVGTSLGGYLSQGAARFSDTRNCLGLLLGLLCLSGIPALLALRGSPRLYDWTREVFPPTPLGVMAAESIVASSVFLVPTVFLGAMVSRVFQAARDQGLGLGGLLCLNAIGSSIAAPVFILWLIPSIGIGWTMKLLFLVFLAPAPHPAGGSRVRMGIPLLALLFAPGPAPYVPLGPSERLTQYEEGRLASIAVVESKAGERSLRVNNRFQMGSTAAVIPERRQAYLPLLLHPEPRTALFLGVGTGITVGAASRYPGLKIDAVEMLPELLDLLPAFSPENFDPAQNPNVHLIAADARRWVQSAGTQYDLVVGDIFQPGKDGAGGLYTVEHFRAIRARLARGGICCQWLPVYQMGETTFRMILRSFLEAFPHTSAWVLRFNVDSPVVGLVGSADPLDISPAKVSERMRRHDLRAALTRVGLSHWTHVLGCFLADRPTLVDHAKLAPLNTDDHPRVTFTAPRFLFRRHTTPYGRLMSLLDRTRRHEGAPALMDLNDGEEARWERFRRSRDWFLYGLVKETRGNMPAAIVDYLKSLGLSREFPSSYSRCITISTAFARQNPSGAKALLETLVRLRPKEPLAARLLDAWFPAR